MIVHPMQELSERNNGECFVRYVFTVYCQDLQGRYHLYPLSETMTVYNSFVDFLCLFPDVLCMMNYFKSWLKDCGTDSENIHLILPSRINCSPGKLF